MKKVEELTDDELDEAIEECEQSAIVQMMNRYATLINEQAERIERQSLNEALRDQCYGDD